MTVATPALFVALFIAFAIIALPPTSFLVSELELPPYLWAGAACVALALYGYLVFWLYFIAPWLGGGFDVLLAIGSIVWFAAYRRQLRASADIVIPGVLMLSLGLVYIGALSVHTANGSLERATVATYPLPGDDVLPRYIADALANGDDPRRALVGWQSSDRPPLQSGLVLLQRPFIPPLLWVSQGYPLLAILVQLSWVAALWGVIRAIGASVGRSVVAIGIVASSYFVYLNTIFTWPKMIAAALVLFALALVLRAALEKRQVTRDETMLAALAVALGMLAHGGVAFSVPFIALLWLVPPMRPSRAIIASGLMLFVALELPWTLYQKAFDPPADRLLKWHLAGVQSADDPRPFVKTLIESYQGAGIKNVAYNKWSNFTSIFPGPNWPTTATLRDDRAIYASNDTSFSTVFGALGVLNGGWLVLLMLPFLKPRPSETLGVSIVLAVSLAGLAFMIALLFGPLAAVNYQGSYAINLGLAGALAVLVTRLPLPLVVVVAAYSAFAFVRTCVLFSPSGELPFGALALATFGLGVFGYVVLLLVERPHGQRAHYAN